MHDCSYEVERFRRLSAIEKIGWWEIDFFTREIICSDYLCTLFGMKTSTLSFYQFGRMIWDDCRNELRHDFLALVKEKAVYERVFPINAAHGVVWVRFRLGNVWISKEGHRQAFGILQEVSAHNHQPSVSQRAYTALGCSEDMLYNLFSNIPVGIEVYDVNGLLIHINNKDMEIFGIKDRKEVLGINFFANPNISLDIRERIESEDQFIYLRNYELGAVNNHSTAREKGHLELYTRISKIYGSKNDYIGFVLVNIDNIESVGSTNRIRKFEHFFSLISDFAKVGYAKLNLFTRDGYAIKQWYKNMGEDESTPLPRIVGVYGKMHPEDREHVLNFYSEARKGKETYFKSDMRVLKIGTADDWNWVRMHIIVTQYEPEHGLIELIGVNYDISEQKENEHQLIEAKEKAEEADRLKTAFLANMSHEIRTPLNAIVGFSSLLTEAGTKEEKQEYLKVVEDNNERLLRLISDILDLSRIETDKYAFRYEEMDMNILCEDIIASMRFKAQPEVRLIFKPSILPGCLVISDCNRLQQVISNFVSNAIKFTPKGVIELGYDKPDEGHIRLYVRDTGIGIAKAECTRIFDRFVKLNVFKQGSGLGLSICKSIVEQLGGQIGVDSELGKGSCFWFVLPIKRKE